MTSMIGTPYFADHLIDLVDTNDGRAVAAALNALAYEQRTANLIAAATATFANGQGMFPAVADQKQQEILIRLGLEDPR